MGDGAGRGIVMARLQGRGSYAVVPIVLGLVQGSLGFFE